jgi:hypothetical protein
MQKKECRMQKKECRMQKKECRMKNGTTAAAVDSAFYILHSAF